MKSNVQEKQFMFNVSQRYPNTNVLAFNSSSWVFVGSAGSASATFLARCFALSMSACTSEPSMSARPKEGMKLPLDKMATCRNCICTNNINMCNNEFTSTGKITFFDY